MKKILHFFRQYKKWKQSNRLKFWYKAWDFWLNLLLATGAVIPLMIQICRDVPFSYEVNDDATIVQILDGSYTGTPDAHGIFVRYPLSYLIKLLYELKPVIHAGTEIIQPVNWYIGTIVFMEIFALTAVLFRVLNYFTYNRLILCLIFDCAFVLLWLPCFSNMTFSTAAAFMGCMGMLFFGLEKREEVWRPWNVLILGIILVSCFCLRKQCFYMILPFIGIEFFLKYHIHFFRSVKPWFVGTFFVLLFSGVIILNNSMYGSREWKEYQQYNKDRAYLQDYKGFPEYDDNQMFYEALGISENERDAMAGYTYCLVDGFSPEQVEKTWLYVKAKEKEKPLVRRIKKAEPKAKKYLLEYDNAGSSLKKASFYFYLCLIPLYLLTVVFYPKKEWKAHIRNLSAGILMSGLLWMEWVYLAINGRFPQRVEETIRLLTLCVGILLVSKILYLWKRNKLTHMPVFLQLFIIFFVCQNGFLTGQIEKVKGKQEYRLMYASEKAEILSYCGKHKDNYYVLDTRSFTKMSAPSDNMHQGNWFMSGSWAAYSPLYTQKLKANGISALDSKFLLKKNVYIITKGKKNMSKLLGLSEEKEAKSVIVDEIMTSSNNFYMIYKVTKILENK